MGLQLDWSMLDAMDFLDMAVQVEVEAEDHYNELITWLKDTASPEALDFFEKMAVREARHRNQIKAKRAELFGDTPSRYPDWVPWEVEAPEDWQHVEPAVDLAKALEMSLAMESNARDYYANVIDYAQDTQVEEILVGLKAAEEEHVRLVQSEIDKL
jgi:rubrerythrin